MRMHMRRRLHSLCSACRSARGLAAVPRGAEEPAVLGAGAAEEAGALRRPSLQVHRHLLPGGHGRPRAGPPQTQGSV